MRKEELRKLANEEIEKELAKIKDDDEHYIRVHIKFVGQRGGPRRGSFKKPSTDDYL